MSIFKKILLSISLISSVIFLPNSFSAETVLITGANRGIGLALAEQFQEAGYNVIGTARKPTKAKKLSALGVRLEQLDIADPTSVSALAERLDGAVIDILVNNAGIGGHSTDAFSDLDIEKLHKVFNVNSFGPLRVTQALLPNLDASKNKRVASISSKMGSIELNTWGCCFGYRGSKAALNSFNKVLSMEFGKQGFVFVVLHPGFVKTDMTRGRGNLTTKESSSGLFKVISELKAEDNGKFYDYQGKPLPW